jgi:hypothetical protein
LGTFITEWEAGELENKLLLSGDVEDGMI